MQADPTHRYGNHKRRHSFFGIAAAGFFFALFVGGPFVWPTPQTPHLYTAKMIETGENRLLLGHSGPTVPALLLSDPSVVSAPLGQTSASGGRPGQSSPNTLIAPTVATSLVFSHTNIATTWFWVGEPADADNAYISNVSSAWDGNWQAHYGGPDAPNSRNGYNPSGFTPKENPFYFALPYSDIASNGSRKSTAANCPNKNDSKYSWCKNGWIAIRHNGKIAYAQWEDVGPNNEDDFKYVFGTAMPTNTFGAHAGLDVSPAVRDYLGLQDVDKADWTLISAASVPSGPWKNIITASVGDNTVN